MDKNDPPIVVEHIFNNSVQEIWASITELDKMRQWYFGNIESFIPEVGFETQFIVKSEERTFPHLWKITEVSPPTKITYNWKFEGYEGGADVTFEIFEKENGSLLRVTNKVIESFTSDIPEFKAESCRAGWNYFIKESLKEYLEKVNNP